MLKLMHPSPLLNWSVCYYMVYALVLGLSELQNVLTRVLAVFTKFCQDTNLGPGGGNSQKVGKLDKP